MVSKENFVLYENKSFAEDFCKIIDLVEDGVIPKNVLKKILGEIYKDNISISSVVEKFSNKEQDEDLINKVIEDIISKNSKQVEEYKSGKTKILGFFVGQVLKLVKDVDPGYIKNQIVKKLDSI